MRRPAAASVASLGAIAVVLAAVVGLLAAGGLGTAASPRTAAALTSPAASLGPEPSTAGTASRPSPLTVPVSPSAAAPATQPPATPSPAVPAPTPFTPEARNTLLQKAIDAYRKSRAIPGISVTVDFADGTTWTGVSGLADVATKARVTPETTFAIGSISKTFLATLVIQLAAEGRLGLDDRVAPHLPELRLDRRITVRQLLDHTSGLYDYFLNPKIDSALQRAPTRTWTAKQALAYMRTRYFAPGKGWHYSNANYLILGLLAEKVAGAPLADQFRERYLGPLGLASTWYQIDEEPRGDEAHGYRFYGTSRKARPVDVSDGTGVMPFTSVVSAADGAGSIAATSADIAHWARALYRGDVLTARSFAIMLGDVARTAVYKPRVPYGLGVQAVRVNGLPTLGHSGRLLGFRSVVRYFPGQDVSIAVLTNQSRADPGPLVARLARIVIPPAPPACAGCAATP